ncbi:MAG TPA: hypothetical protein VGI03_16320 [Verrucomicrobiae bacterium]
MTGYDLQQPVRILMIGYTKNNRAGVHPVMHTNELQIMEESGPNPEVRIPRAIRLGLLTCCASALGSYEVSHIWVSRLQVWWMEGLGYALLPLSMTFIVLYRSCWRREITGAPRVSYLLLYSCIILGSEILATMLAVVLIFGAVLLCLSLVAFCANAFSGGNH